MTATNLADLYELPVLDWATLVDHLDAGIPQAPGDGGNDRHTCWLTTINPDGSPHVTAQVTDPPTVAAMAARWAAGGWPARVDGSGTALTADFSAPSAGPPPWHVYRVTARAASAVATVEPGGATRWTF